LLLCDGINSALRRRRTAAIASPGSAKHGKESMKIRQIAAGPATNAGRRLLPHQPQFDRPMTVSAH
jgi:hypothetical protein